MHKTRESLDQQQASMRKRKSFYLSGKITGIENEAPALFAQAEKEVINMGFSPVNPMTIKHNHNKTWQSFMREDVKALCDCDGIYMLSNWRESNGAKIELAVANHLELDVMHQHRALSNLNK